MNDILFLAAAVAIALLGVVYWVYTSESAVRRKVELLENVVYELRYLIQQMKESPDSEESEGAEEGSPNSQESSDTQAAVDDGMIKRYPSPPASEVEELEKDEMKEVIDSMQDFDTTFPSVESVAEISGDLNSDLQPGGVGSGLIQEKEDLASSTGPLESLTVKQLRKMADNNNIARANKMSKTELIANLRATATKALPYATVSDELDLQL